MTFRVIPTQLQLAAWNFRNLRAREEYRAHPSVAGGENRYYAACDHCQTFKEQR